MNKIKVLIVDDSQLIQDVLSTILNADSRFELLGCAKDPYVARQMIKDLSPDVITLDVEMPKMNGIAFLKNLMRLKPLPVVMISTLTTEGSGVTFQALELGAVDFIEKPSDLSQNFDHYAERITNTIYTAASVSKAKLRAFQARLTRNDDTPAKSPAATPKPAATAVSGRPEPADKLIAIGGSTGGLEALRNLLEATRFTGKESIVVCLHLPGGFTESYAKRLNSILPVTVKEAEENERIIKGHIYIAPGGRHLSVKKRAAGFQCIISDEPPVNMHRPSVEVLFESVAHQAGANAMGIILTGMGRDGGKGLRTMLDQGAATYAQDEASSVVWGMPGSAVEAGAVNQRHVQNLQGLAKAMSDYIGKLR